MRRYIVLDTFLMGMAAAFLMGSSLLAQAQAPSKSSAQPATEVLWLGQAGFRIKSPSGKAILIDPWITGGPKAPAIYKNDLSAIGPIDLLLVTHAHVDHIGDAPALAKMNNTKLYGPADMVTPLITLGILPADLGHRFNKTGRVTPLPGIKVTAVQAEHSSLLVWKNPATEKMESHAAGEAMGYIIELENGFKIWHMGDTGLFGDMKFIGEHYKPDLVMIPIGGNFTMAPDDAAFALRTWVKPKMVIPMHYNSNPLAKGTLAEFQGAMKGSTIKIIPMTEGQTVQF
ncbi:metal-dependent hydrolase [Polynucleobacter sp. Adler-ghost]|uniref:metal-dependent hydrolase n=1 Tax=Polynucleobacter sp. Adler-ghost TaxID=2770234 RepID=UPI001BFEB559|nr:metal-dependent hydrolase [Polynucleobacter sp. Adler-ghost]QWE30352.1 metal-dependent hydrolase [Polynucleobacter sp. Adler-ghost]